MDYIRETEKIVKQYNTWKAEIIDIDLKIAELNEEDGMTGIDTTRESTGKTYKITSITENVGVNIADQVVLLELRKRHLERLIQRLDNALNALTEDEKEIIIRAVIKGQRYYQFTYQIYKCERQCKRIKRIALDKISKIIFNTQNMSL